MLLLFIHRHLHILIHVVCVYLVRRDRPESVSVCLHACILNALENWKIIRKRNLLFVKILSRFWKLCSWNKTLSRAKNKKKWGYIWRRHVIAEIYKSRSSIPMRSLPWWWMDGDILWDKLLLCDMFKIFVIFMKRLYTK